MKRCVALTWAGTECCLGPLCGPIAGKPAPTGIAATLNLWELACQRLGCKAAPRFSSQTDVDNLSHIFLEPHHIALASPCFHRLYFFHG